MRTLNIAISALNIAISDLEYNKFGLQGDQLSFTDFVDMVSRELSRQTLSKCAELSERYGLNTLTMEDVSSEIRAVRNNAAHS